MSPVLPATIPCDYDEIHHFRTADGAPFVDQVECSRNVMAHGNARDGKLEWVASTLHTTSEHGVSSITTADAHTSAVSSRLNWRPSRFKWTRPFRQKTKSGFCACAIAFQTQSTTLRNSKIHYRVQKNPITDPILGHKSPVLLVKSHFFGE